MGEVYQNPEYKNYVKPKIKNKMKKQIIPQDIINWARANNQRIVVNEDGIIFEDMGKPINWSNIICYSIIVLGIIGLIFQMTRI